jgi:selenocysteine lyase/cysteine desulfurase
MSGRLRSVRASFPALGRVEGGHPVAYFDGPGGTQVPAMVADAVRDYLLHHNANTHWAYPTSAETDAALAGARERLADFLNAGPEEIAFGANMTTLAFHAARALVRGCGPGDVIVVAERDHHANVAPWQAVARERGVTLRLAKLDTGRGVLDAADLTAAIGPRTRLVAIGAAAGFWVSLQGALTGSRADRVLWWVLRPRHLVVFCILFFAEWGYKVWADANGVS